MSINWYPGHMHKAQKEMRKILPNVDIVIEVLDARIPFSSENPLVAEILGTKPVIKVFSKSDLTDKAVLEAWQAHFEQVKDVKTFPIDIHNKSRTMQLIPLCVKHASSVSKGTEQVRAMVVGIPNVGKSTLINTLTGRTIAKTGNEPAVTKTQQVIHVNDDLMLLDTPGILWPKQEFEKSSYRLAVTGAIRDTAMRYDDVGFFAAEFMLEAYPERLENRYQLGDYQTEPEVFLEALAKKRGCIAKGGAVDWSKVCELLVKEIRAGYLGELCFEEPEKVKLEVEEAEKIKAINEEKKLQKKNKKKVKR